MMLTRLTAQLHDYNLKLTKAELITLAAPNWASEDFDAHAYLEVSDKLHALINKEADRLGERSGE